MREFLAALLAAMGMAVMAGCDGPSGLGSATVPPRPVFNYPCQVERLNFPDDEGYHSVVQWPHTLVEWYAIYSHLTAEDGSRYLLFTTFVTFDPVESLVAGRFPHVISTLIDIDRNCTYQNRAAARLKRFAAGHVDVESAAGDYLRWKGLDRPFDYDFRIAWRTPQADWSVTTELSAVKLPLAVGGGYVQQPQGISGYYSQTRLATTGEMTLNGVRRKVSGTSWIDRQWLGPMTTDRKRYGYDWWALQLDNHEEAILYRITDNRNGKIVSTLLEICRSDGRREHIDQFTLVDESAGWRLTAPGPGWDIAITPTCYGHRPGQSPPVGERGARWFSCRLAGSVRGRPATGLAVAELVPSSPGADIPSVSTTQPASPSLGEHH